MWTIVGRNKMAEWNYLDIFEDLRLKVAMVQPHWTTAMIPTLLGGTELSLSTLLFRRTHYQCKSQGPPLSLWLFVVRILANRFEYVRRAKCRAKPSLDTSAAAMASWFLAFLPSRVRGFPPHFLRSRLDVGREHSHNFSRLDARPFFSRLADEL